VQVRRLWLAGFRSYAEADVALAPGLTAVLGANGEGKTNLLEAIGFLGTLASLRGAPQEAMIRRGCDRAVVRAECERDERPVLIEAEFGAGRTRVLVNRQRLARSRDLLGALRVSPFAPDDLALVKAGPGLRRRYLDDTLVALHPRHDRLRAEVERVLRQRNALLRQAGGRLDARMSPAVRRAYADVAGRAAEVTIEYVAPWRAQGLAAALTAARSSDLRRGVSSFGPHRDDLAVSVDGMPARTHASQGEQRCLALALRLAAHRVVTDEVGEPPVLLLDDVFSELDPDRSAALVAHLPAGQTVLTSAGALPPGAHPELVLRVKDGTVVEEA
jgi:DNA replication and repair protein RecF